MRCQVITCLEHRVLRRVAVGGPDSLHERLDVHQHLHADGVAGIQDLLERPQGQALS